MARVASSGFPLPKMAEAATINHTPQATYLVKRGADERLPAKSGIDRHYEHVINKRQSLFDCRKRGCRIKHYAGPTAKLAYRHKSSVKVDDRFRMDRDQVRPGPRKVVNVEVR